MLCIADTEIYTDIAPVTGVKNNPESKFYCHRHMASVISVYNTISYGYGDIWRYDRICIYHPSTN